MSEPKELTMDEQEKRKMSDTEKPRFSKGQIVRINTDFYKHKRKAEQYQRITSVWRWPGKEVKNDFGSVVGTLDVSPKPPRGTPHWGYTLANGDCANEKYLCPLTPKEAGVK